MVVDLLRKLKAKDKKLQELDAKAPNGAADDLTQQVSSLQLALQQAKDTEAKDQAAREALEQQAARITAALHEAQQDTQALQGQLGDRDTQVEAFQHEAHVLRGQLGDRDTQIDALQQRLSELESQAATPTDAAAVCHTRLASLRHAL